MLGFSLFVDVDSYFKYFIQLQKYFLHLNMDFVDTVTPTPLVEDVDHSIHQYLAPPRAPSTPSPCLIPYNHLRQSFSYSTIFADPNEGSNKSNSSTSLLSASWMEQDEIPWTELSHDSSLDSNRDDLLFSDGSCGDVDAGSLCGSMYHCCG